MLLEAGVPVTFGEMEGVWEKALLGCANVFFLRLAAG